MSRCGAFALACASVVCVPACGDSSAAEPGSSDAGAPSAGRATGSAGTPTTLPGNDQGGAASQAFGGSGAGFPAGAGVAGLAAAGANSGGATQAGAPGVSGASGSFSGSPASGGADPGTEGDGDFMVGPSYPVAPELNVKAGVPRGATFKFTMNSTDSAIFKGTDSTLNAANQHSFTRNVLVYVPKQYVDGSEAPFIVSQDLQFGYQTDLMNALDTLINDKSVPALVVVFVDNGGDDSYGSERGLEYDTLSDRYQRFVDAEVLPAVLRNAAIKQAYPNLKLTSDADGRGSFGCSSGAAAAFTMGFFAPNAYRRLMTYSGTFVDQQDSDAAEEKLYPNGAWEYHERLIAAAEPKPLRVFLQVGENDNGATNTEASHHNWVLANQRMAAALKAKGYHYRFVYAKGAKHCDGAVRKHTLPDTLRWMWRGYASK